MPTDAGPISTGELASVDGTPWICVSLTPIAARWDGFLIFCFG